MIKLKKLIKRFIVLIVAIIIVGLIHQLTIFMFFEESKLVKIDGKGADWDSKHMNTIEKEWKGNYLIVKQYSNFGCGADVYVRYNKNRVELLIVEPSISCWGTSYQQINYTVYYNNIISSFKAYFSKDIIFKKLCRTGQSNCIVNSEVMENYDQLKDFGFVKFKKGDCNLDNLNHTYLSNENLSDEKSDFLKNKSERNDDLLNIIRGLEKYKRHSEDKKYPISENISKLNDKDAYVYKELIDEYVRKKYLTDPKDPEFYYGYRSLNGESCEIFMKSEDPKSQCEMEDGFCVIKFPVTTQVP